MTHCARVQATAIYRVQRWQQKTKRWREHRRTRFNRQSRRCLIRYLEIARSLLIYRCYARDVDRDAACVQHDERSPNGT